MLTGQADLNAAMEAVNFGHVFRFHTKPCAPRILEQSVEDALRIFALSQTAPSDNMTARSRDETKDSYDPKPPFKKTATEAGLTAEEIQFLIGNDRN
jgi:DNA-binding NtrC family response regulator